MTMRRFLAGVLMLVTLSGAAPPRDNCRDRGRAQLDRHVYVIYDGSLSYRHEPGYTRRQDIEANLRRVRRLGENLGSVFSLLLTKGYLRYDCFRQRRDDEQVTRLEILGHDGAYYSSRAYRKWMESLSGKLRDIEDRLLEADDETPRPPLIVYTDLEGALHRAAYGFRVHPAHEKYLVIFSDLDHDPDPNPSEGKRSFCEPLDLTDVVVVVANMGMQPPPHIAFRRPEPSQRMRWLESRAYGAGAAEVCYDWDGMLLGRLGLE